jgi:hypothetical protein
MCGSFLGESERDAEHLLQVVGPVSTGAIQIGHCIISTPQYRQNGDFCEIKLLQAGHVMDNDFISFTLARPPSLARVPTLPMKA